MPKASRDRLPGTLGEIIITKPVAMEELPEDKRKRIESEIKEALSYNFEHLVADIHAESVTASPETAPLSRSIARFGTLLCNLSVETDKQTKRIICLTIWLVVLTVVLTFFTAILVYKEFCH